MILKKETYAHKGYFEEDIKLVIFGKVELIPIQKS